MKPQKPVNTAPLIRRGHYDKNEDYSYLEPFARKKKITNHKEKYDKNLYDTINKDFKDANPFQQALANKGTQALESQCDDIEVEIISEAEVKNQITLN